MFREEIDENQIKDILKPFKQENWKKLLKREKKAMVMEFANYQNRILKIENKPKIKYYSEKNDPYISENTEGSCGYYSEGTKTVYINTTCLKDNLLIVEVVAHEYRHCYQHEKANNPKNGTDKLWRENLDNFLSPIKCALENYQSQPTEIDAKDWGEKFATILNGLEL